MGGEPLELSVDGAISYLCFYSMDLYETVEGKDWTESELQDVRDRDAALVRRQGNVDWLHVKESATDHSHPSQQQQQ